MPPTSCKFEFARNPPIYYNGEQISGQIVLTTTKRLQLQAIDLLFVGTGQVEWSEKLNNLDAIEHNDCTDADGPTSTYSGAQEYHRNAIQLVGETTLQPGTSFEANFHFSIPHSASECPATCQQNYGEIAYEVLVVLQRPGNAFAKTFQHPIILKNRMDLNVETELKKKSTICCTTPPIDDDNAKPLEFSVPCTGFVPGQLLRYRIVFSKVYTADEAARVIVNLCQCVTYSSQQPSIKTKQTVTVLASSKHDLGAKAKFVRLEAGVLRIPLTVAISTIKSDCPLKISYYVEAIVMMSGRNAIEQRLRMPITIGTVPLQPAITFGGDDLTSFCYDNLGTTIPKIDLGLEASNAPTKGAFSHSSVLHCSNEMLVLSNQRKTDQILLLPLKLKKYYRNVAEHAV